MKEQPPVFKNAVITLTICIIACLLYAQKGDKKKTAFQQVSGEVLSITNIHEEYPGKDTAKFRYIQVDNYPQPFQVFIGKSSGDFKPTFENIGSLQQGDSLTVYFDETTKTTGAPVNNLAYFMDRGPEVIFIKGNAIKIVVYGVVIFSILVILLLALLKWRNKIT